jgi:hypothetical protein
MTEIQTNPENEKSNLEEKTFRFEKYKFNVDLLKWLIGSVALVIVTTIIDRGFKERTAGIQEMQAYDKYVEIILKADNIEDRWKLSEYFSTVTPTERLRDRWIAYKDYISEDYKIFKTLKEKEFELNKQKNAIFTKDTLSETDKKLNEVQNQLAPFEKRLINSGDFYEAQLWEDKGFSFLINRDVLSAIDAFRNSENSYHQFHQVYEIAKYLNENKSKLSDAKSYFWKTAFGKIANEYSWKMPIETKNKLIENSK